jgi:hypothetical protein
MNIPEVKPIQLTAEEAALRHQMETEFLKSPGKGPYTRKAAHQLYNSLRTRDAIPQARLDSFFKPFPGGRGKSHWDVFEKNGCSGDAIFEHPHFVAYLQYFMNGPALPVSTIEGFRKILIDDSGTSSMIMDQLRRFVRAETRRLRLERGTAKEEFWRLSQEVGCPRAGNIRDAAGSAAK